MHDAKYRVAIAWQNVGYNQPPHPSYFIGHNMENAPFPTIYTRNVQSVQVEMNPETVNVKSNGKENAFTATLEVPTNIEGTIKAIKLMVDGKTIFAEPDFKEEENKLTVKFDRQELLAAFDKLDGEIEVHLIGYVDSGVTIIGKDSVSVIH